MCIETSTTHRVYGMDTEVIETHAQLRTLFGSKKLLVAGVGNRLRGDDGAGPRVIDAIKEKGVQCLDCGVAPENYLEKIVSANPEIVLIVDAVSFEGRAGEMRLFESDQIQAAGLSTHALSLQMVCEYLNARLPVRIFLLAIQPEQIQLGATPSVAVGDAITSLAEIVAGAIPDA